MRIRLEKRQEPSRTMQALTPIGAVLMTMIVGAVIFWAIGYDGPRAVWEIFFTPVLASYKCADVAKYTQGATGGWIVPLMIVVGMVAGAAWAGIAAFLRNRFRVNEILSS